jgi:hypothetical protein
VRSLHAQLISYSVMVFGFSCMILVRWQYTMRPSLPPPRRDVAAMVCSLLVMLVSDLCLCANADTQLITHVLLLLVASCMGGNPQPESHTALLRTSV